MMSDGESFHVGSFHIGSDSAVEPVHSNRDIAPKLVTPYEAPASMGMFYSGVEESPSQPCVGQMHHLQADEEAAVCLLHREGTHAANAMYSGCTGGDANQMPSCGRPPSPADVAAEVGRTVQGLTSEGEARPRGQGTLADATAHADPFEPPVKRRPPRERPPPPPEPTWEEVVFAIPTPLRSRSHKEASPRKPVTSEKVPPPPPTAAPPLVW
jgi:hypothetical protein